MKLNFDNSYSRLPQEFPQQFFSKVSISPFENSFLVHANESTAKLIGLTKADLQNHDFTKYFSGQKQFAGATPIATVYAGHQFGHYVSQLGDGRAILLGEVINKKGERWDVQLKGSGKTPYSRMGDGKAVLRSCIREYLCSEAMHALGIPTTRALCITTSDEPVIREDIEPAAMLTRLAPSHLRFGHFEFFYYSNQHTALKQLADYALERHYPNSPKTEDGYAHLFEQAVLNTAKTLAHWQAIGFCHGVMNTDNMSILGITLDYGPFGFLEGYNPHHICNCSDDNGRYAFDRQPSIAMWNLMAFGQALTPLLDSEKISNSLSKFQPALIDHYAKLIRTKLGFKKKQKNDMQLSSELLKILEIEQTDYTIFFRTLCSFNPASSTNEVTEIFTNKQPITSWLQKYSERLALETSTQQQRETQMKSANPKFILRNYLAQQTIDAAYKNLDFTEVAKLFQILQKPFDDQPENEIYAAPAPSWAHSLKVSCSS